MKWLPLIEASILFFPALPRGNECANKSKILKLIKTKKKCRIFDKNEF
jgi:hypothetical protein